MVRFAIALLGFLAVIGGCKPADQSNDDGLGSGSNHTEASQNSRSGPFGIDLGQPMDQLELEAVNEGEDGSTRILSTVPKPVADIELVAVKGFAETGVCEIRGVSRDFESDAYGVQVKSAMAALAESLDSKYGKHKKTDQCGSYNCEFFQMNLRDGSQVHLYQWNEASGANLPEGMDEIALGANASQFNDTYYRLDYRLTDLERCSEASNKAKASSL